ncbi:hypothetical protein [Tardiphaga sp.]|uniref:hypothetical protein n=1 Tax=Tardiphaga sp. TaxID=1926292 RepID=UPI0026102BE9|nr:hypothetical protein [Tardiphaga sp.]MDB5616352.1 hypothetical protein [Tardiphaga sp.]
MIDILLSVPARGRGIGTDGLDSLEHAIWPRQVSDTKERLSRLYASIETGTIDGTDPTLKERVAGLKATRNRALDP